MKLAIVITSGDPESTWNAFRLANMAKEKGDDAKVFLVARSVEYEKYSSDKYPSRAEADKFVNAGGSIMACFTCMKSRHQEGTNLCPVSSLKDLYALVKESDKAVSF